VESAKFPVNFPVSRESGAETGPIKTASSATQSVSPMSRNGYPDCPLSDNAPRALYEDSLRAITATARGQVPLGLKLVSDGGDARLSDRRIACLTYRKYPGEDWPQEEFVPVRLSSGELTTIRLAERGTWLGRHHRSLLRLGTGVVMDRLCPLHPGLRSRARLGTRLSFRFGHVVAPLRVAAHYRAATTATPRRHNGAGGGEDCGP
jgi:hypothetical protein